MKTNCTEFQKQPFRGVLRKRFSDNMQEILRENTHSEVRFQYRNYDVFHEKVNSNTLTKILVKVKRIKILSYRDKLSYLTAHFVETIWLLKTSYSGHQIQFKSNLETAFAVYQRQCFYWLFYSFKFYGHKLHTWWHGLRSANFY